MRQYTWVPEDVIMHGLGTYNIKRKARNAALILAICISVILLYLVLKRIFPMPEDSLISLFISLAEAVGLLVSLLIAVYQLKDSKEIARATFIIELNRSFIENEDFTDLYDKLQACFDGDCKCRLDHNKCDKDKNSLCALDVEKSVISNYLTFFETVYILHKKGVISFDILDDLFAYRFFLAIHSKYVQQKKLIYQPQNFTNIYLLEKEWLAYRVRIGKMSADALLQARKGYNIDGKKSVYTSRLLVAMLGEEAYNDVINKK